MNLTSMQDGLLLKKEKTDLLHKYNRISLEDAEAGWKAQYERTRDHCIHGLGCKTGPSCKTGCRITQIHLLCGGIIPLLSALEMAMAKNADKIGLSKESRSLRVVRVELDNGQRLVGLRYPEQLIPEATLFLKEQKSLDAVMDKQNGVLSSTEPSKQPSKASRAYEEPETPINQRLLTKATTPPVTIKNFFKPKTIERSPESNKSASEHQDVKEKSGEKDCNEIENQEIDNNVKNSTDNKQATTRVSKKEVKSIYFRSKGRENEELPENKGPFKGAAKCNDLVRHLSEPLSKENLQGKNSLKRTSSEASSRAIKRQKQSSILSSFGKRTDKDSKDQMEKEILCPVCGEKFASGLKNSYINKHIDNCLIKYHNENEY